MKPKPYGINTDKFSTIDSFRLQNKNNVQKILKCITLYYAMSEKDAQKLFDAWLNSRSYTTEAIEMVIHKE
ncbi:MAG: hypothetical protein GY804_11480 [Alphaproteobacteria bacterium]|nr:hypothetical protein [Alphaproteobacteria bacterium]